MPRSDLKRKTDCKTNFWRLPSLFNQLPGQQEQYCLENLNRSRTRGSSWGRFGKEWSRWWSDKPKCALDSEQWAVRGSQRKVIWERQLQLQQQLQKKQLLMLLKLFEWTGEAASGADADAFMSEWSKSINISHWFQQYDIVPQPWRPDAVSSCSADADKMLQSQISRNESRCCCS